ncbi:MAG: hypothetical protein HC833_15030 [Leptolyngbyaceae cyanobacterium RM1_406_9]|nr:hypothetical protein [Leptolyngbyaceae cyanobacterium RM1_406_9]
MRVHLFLVAAIGLALASCIAMPGDSVGGDRPPIAYPLFGSSDSVDTYPMLEDPEAEFEEASEEIWATSQADADSRCQKMAENRTKEGGTLVTVQGKAEQRTSRPSSTGSYKFVCRFRVEL